MFNYLLFLNFKVSYSKGPLFPSEKQDSTAMKSKDSEATLTGYKPHSATL